MKWLANEMKHTITAEEAAWITKTAYADAGADKQLNPVEFNKFGNSFVNHFGLCAEAKAAEEKVRAKLAK
jgi:hypothetical protein